MMTFILGTPAVLLLVSNFVVSGASKPLAQAEQPGGSERAGSDVLGFVRVALRDRLSAGDIPDIGIARAPDAAQVYVRADLPTSRLVLTAEALPEITGLNLKLIELSEARDLAERAGTRVSFVTVDRVQVGRDSASLWLGADFVTPKQPGVVKLCCCEGEARFIKRDGQWVFDKWGFRRCS